MTTDTTLKKGYKYRIYPNKEQEKDIAKVFGSCRYVYNRLLHESIEEHKLYKEDPEKHTKPEISIREYSTKIVKWKNEEETSWLADVSSVPLQQASRHLVSAFSTFFKKKKGYPNFKSKKNKQSASFTVSGYRIKEKKLWLGRLKSGITVKWSRELPSEPNTCIISKEPSGKYYVSFICEYSPTRTEGQGIVGVDVGITDLAVMSSGEFINNPRHFSKNQTTLAKLQKRLSKKQKGSKNREKARLKVAKIHEKIKYSRLDFIHKLSSRLIRENQAIAIESLMVKNMVKNRKLAKHISDAAWGMFRQHLVYKVNETISGKLLIADPYYPSTQLCNTCNKRPKRKIALGTTKWTCSFCSTVHQRDHNAAINLEILLRASLKNWEVGAKVVLANRYHSLA